MTNPYRSYGLNKILAGVKDIKFLHPTKPASDYKSISFEFDLPIKMSENDTQFNEALEFLHYSFLFFLKKYEEEYFFHSPLLSFEPRGSKDSTSTINLMKLKILILKKSLLKKKEDQ